MKRVAGVFVLLLAISLPAHAQDRCHALKLQAAGKTGAGEFKCNAKADSSKGTAAHIADCSQKPDTHLMDGYLKAEAKGPCSGTGADAQSALDGCESAANTAVGNAGSPRTKSRCDAKKMDAMGKKLFGLLHCDAKNAARPDASKLIFCMTKATAKFGIAMGKLKNRDCTIAPGPADTVDLEMVIDNCRTNVDNTLPSGTTTTTTTTTSTSST